MDQLTLSYQAATVALNEYFCNGYAGRTKTDPVYQYVVEKRDVPATYKSYSSCADRAHAVLYRLGCREKFVNRAEHKCWHIGANISALSFGPSFSKKPGKDWCPDVGDEMIIWNTKSGTDAHSLAIVEYKPTKNIAVTANYGSAGMSVATFPGCKFSDSSLAFDSATGNWTCGHRIVQRVLKLSDLVKTFTVKPNLTYLDGDLLPDMSRGLDEILALRPELGNSNEI